MDKVFQRRMTSGGSLPVLMAVGLNPVAGEIGLEIECEGNSFQKEQVAKGWKFVHDGSLRGQDNAEYVLKKPLLFSEVPGHLDALWKMMETHGTKLDISNRTSVHVHLNCQEFYMDRLACFVGLYMAFEEILTNWCGDHRVGNLFCLRAKDAPAIVSEIKEFIRRDCNYSLSEGLHYGGLNLHALVKFGSLEIRTLRGETNPEVIKDWVKILATLYNKSAVFITPDEVCALFSKEGPTYFFDSVFGPLAGTIRRGCNMTSAEIDDSLYEGIRLAQDVLYSRDWSVFQKATVKVDPFGRKVKAASQAPSPGGMTDYLASINAIPSAWQPAPPPNPVSAQAFYNEFHDDENY